MRALVAFLTLSVITACGGGSIDRPAPITVTVSPNVADVGLGDTVPFSAKVTGPGSKTVHWRISGVQCDQGACGQISIRSTGVFYVAPNNIPDPPSFLVIATSDADPSKSGSAVITLKDPWSY